MKKFLLTIAVVLGVCSVFAQRRSDMAVKLLSPSNGQVYNDGDTLKVKFEFKNLGPASWIVGDSIICARPGQANGVLFLVDRTIAQNDTIMTRTFAYGKAVAADTNVTSNFCYICIIRNGANPIKDTNDDVNINTFNNGDCKSVTVKGKPVAINDVNEAAKVLAVYPNPANSEIHFSAEGFANKTFDVQIIDMMGRPALTQSFKNANSDQKINISHLSKGIYQIRISQDGHRYIGKFSKQ